MPLHKNITDPEIHEPKGVATSSAGQIYVSDGQGSGRWTYPPTGYVRYAHSGAGIVYDTTPSKLVSNGLGSNSTEDYLPLEIRGTGQSLWDIATNKVTPIAVGDAYTMRINLPITTITGSPTVLTVVLDIGGGATITIPILTEEISITKTAPFSISITTNFDSLNTFLANGGQFFISVNAGTITVTNPTVQVTRTHGEIV